MFYLDDYNFFKKNDPFKSKISSTPCKDVITSRLSFNSAAKEVDYLKKELHENHNDIIHYIKSIFPGKNVKLTEAIIKRNDSSSLCNYTFDTILFRNTGKNARKGLIIMLHGLNERNWNKYYTWALNLANNTGKSVLLFPIAFHMNRGPSEWENSRAMNALSRERQILYPGLQESSFVNAALSTRLQFFPELFFHSGHRTYNDLKNLIISIRQRNSAIVEPDAGIDFFGYSIGAFLSLIFLMSDNTGYLSSSKTFLFCGGAAMDMMYPVSRFIYDSKAGESINRSYITNFDGFLNEHIDISHFLESGKPEFSAFEYMLKTKSYKKERAAMLDKLRNRLASLTLIKDEVIPPDSVKNILGNNEFQPGFLNETLDFDYEYNHASPFPLSEKISVLIDKAHNKVLEIAADWLR